MSVHNIGKSGYANVNNSEDMSHIYPRRNDLGMAGHALEKGVLSIQPV
jgi:hypothetical protein